MDSTLVQIFNELIAVTAERDRLRQEVEQLRRVINSLPASNGSPVVPTPAEQSA